MTLLSAILGLILLVAVSLGFVLARLAYTPEKPLEDVVEAYSRLKGSVERRPETPEAVRDHLRQTRRDFGIVWNACRMLAPASADPDFVPKLFQAYFSFQARYLILQMDLILDGTRMAEHLQDLSRVSGGLVRSSENWFSPEMAG